MRHNKNYSVTNYEHDIHYFSIYQQGIRVQTLLQCSWKNLVLLLFRCPNGRNYMESDAYRLASTKINYKKNVSIYSIQIYKLLQRRGPSTSVAYLHLQYEFKLLFIYILAEKLLIINILPRYVEEAIGALTSIVGH